MGRRGGGGGSEQWPTHIITLLVITKLTLTWRCPLNLMGGGGGETVIHPSHYTSSDKETYINLEMFVKTGGGGGVWTMTHPYHYTSSDKKTYINLEMSIRTSGGVGSEQWPTHIITFLALNKLTLTWRCPLGPWGGWWVNSDPPI